ncbi:MAG TPA: acyltransferase family protein [Burkholderiaceae bacterium]|nr:acyltransferase family protein [Burkholderiaceae bacterium]
MAAAAPAGRSDGANAPVGIAPGDEAGRAARRGRYRTDIQALRGIAVLLVVFYHLGWFGLDGGYLGVDMFFVVSGYVITQLIRSRVAAGAFSVREFYWRRAWRLLPALLATLAASAVAARWLLTEIDLRAFADQGLGALFLVANVVLWRQGGYFDAPAVMKPLLHLWSLSIEQQFYLLFPWLFIAAAARRVFVWLALASGISFALALWLAVRAPEAGFYLLSARIWEFGLGALAAAAASGGAPSRRPGPAFSMLALGALLLAALRPFGPWPPVAAALLVCVATAALLRWPSRWLAQGAVARLLAACGTISYSLYLVHWPLLAFYRHYSFSEVLAPGETVGLFVVSILLAVALYAGVERTLRRTPPTALRRFGVLGVSVLLLMLWCGAARAQTDARSIDWASERRPNHGLAIECEYDGSFELRPGCMTTPHPKLLVWGDSVAMQYVAGLTDGLAARHGLVQATMSTCGPLLGVAPVYSGRLGEDWARRCIAFNDSVFAWLSRQPGITHVLLSARFLDYVESGQQLLTRQGLRPQALVFARPLLAATVERLRGAGKTVVILAPPPEEGFDVGACTERLSRGKSIGRRSSCDIERRAYETLQRDAIALLRSAPAPVLWPGDLLCDAARCAVSIDRWPIYRDAAHFSYRGSVLFARHFDLARKVLP